MKYILRTLRMSYLSRDIVCKLKDYQSLDIFVENSLQIINFYGLFSVCII